MEVWKKRVQRYPNNLAFKYEPGYRYMLTKRYADAIQELQVAKNDPRRKGRVCWCSGSVSSTSSSILWR